MDKTIDKNHLWALLAPLAGPLLASSLLLVILFRTTGTPLGIPMIALGGVAICYLLKWRGVAVASSVLASMLAYNLWHQPAALWPWLIVLALCAASTFVVTVLCSEESVQKWEQLTKNIDDSKNTISFLSERVASGQKQLMQEKVELLHANENLKAQLADMVEKTDMHERAAKSAKDEASAVHAGQEKLLQELDRVQKENGTLANTLKDAKRQLDDALARSYQEARKAETYSSELVLLQEQLKAAKNFDKVNEELRLQHETSLKELNGHIDSLKQEKIQLKAEMAKRISTEESLAKEHADKAANLEQRLSETSAQLASLRAEKERAQSECVAAERKAAAASDELAKQNLRVSELLLLQKQIKTDLDAARQRISDLEQESAKAVDMAQDKEFRRLTGLHQQLRQQFADKTNTLAATRRELFHTQEKLLALQKDFDDLKLYDETENHQIMQRLLAEAGSEIEQSEKEHAVEVTQLHALIDACMVK